MNLRKNTPADAVVVDEPTAGSSKRVLVAGGVAAGLAVVAAMSYVLLSGGSGDTETGVVAAAKNPVAQSKPTASAATSAPAIKKFTGKNARDPFKALVVEPAAVVGATAGATPAPTAAPAPGGTGSTSPTAAPIGGSSTPVTLPSPTYSSPAPSATKAKSTTISMVAVASGDTSARLKVDGKSYEVKPLEEFGTYFKLLNLRESTCGAVQYGDVTFDLCEGESRTFR